MSEHREHRLEINHFAVAIAAFGVASAMAVMQALSRANVNLPFRSESLYYISMTAHGVLMALVFTTFFIMGLGYLLVRQCLGRITWERLAHVSF